VDHLSFLPGIPGAALVVRRAHRHHLAHDRMRGTREQNAVGAAPGRRPLAAGNAPRGIALVLGAQPQGRALDDGGDERRDRLERLVERRPAVAAHGEGTVAGIGAVLLPRGRVDRPIHHLDGRHFSRPDPPVAVSVDRAYLPRVTAVVAVEEVSAVDRRIHAVVRDMVGGHDEAAGVGSAPELDAVARTGGVPPVPLRRLELRGQVTRRGPPGAVVVAVLNERAPVAGVGSRIVGRHQDHTPRALVHDGHRVAARVARAVEDDLEGRPGLPAVARALQDEVDVAVVAAICDATLREGEQGAVRRLDDRRDAEAEVAALRAREQHLLVVIRNVPRSAPRFHFVQGGPSE
jgi:hypothetical protein